MIKIEILVLGIGKLNGAWDDPNSKAFQLRNPLLLKSYRPEKQVDSEHYRVFTSFGGGMKAGVADILAKSSGKNHRLTPENTLRDMLSVFGFADDRATRKILLFIQRGLNDESVTLNTELSWFLQHEVEEVKEMV